MKSTQKQDALAVTRASQTETVENRQMHPHYSMLDAALQYAQRGWYVFPCREAQGEPYQDKKGNWKTPKEKMPYTTHGLHNASINPDDIRRWWKKWPRAMIGINCGKSGLFVVDLDKKHGKDGVNEFACLGLDDSGALRSQTVSGGLHLIFVGSGKSSTSDVGIDTRGDGGSFIAPPSEVLVGEATGKYIALNDWSQAPGPIPAGLLEVLESLHPKPSKPHQDEMTGTIHGKLSRTTLEFIAHGTGQGQRNDKLFRAACDLAGNHYTQAEAENMFLPVGQRIGLPESETLRTIESAYSRSRMPAIPQASQNNDLSLDPADPFTDEKGVQPELFDIPIGLQARYRVINSAFYAVEHDRDGAAKYRLLANWHASVTHEVARDDGQEIVRKMKITGHLASGAGLPVCEVDAASFSSMNWVLQYWGTRAIIAAGQSTKDKLREAIQWASQDAMVSTVYTHTGWRVIDGQRVYLTTSGALGKGDIQVDLDGNLKRYALPTSLDGINLKEATQASLRFLQVAPLGVTFPLWSSMFLAPLAEITPFDFLLWVFGETGSMKSTLCALALCHYGDFDHKHLPDGWGSTDNILEKQMFIAKDAPLIIDDFAPQASGVDAQNLDRKAARLIRAVGNHSPRNRMNADTSTRSGFMARGLVISTGEQLPAGQSIIARILPIEVLPKTVNIELLTQAQTTDARLYPYALAGYLQWLIQNWDELKTEYTQKHHEMRDSLRGTFHLRTPEMFAHLLMGVRLGLTYAMKEGAISEPEAEALLEQAKAEMMKLAQDQGDHVQDELPAIKFINAIKALIAKGEFYIEGVSQLRADTAKWLGWADKDFYYLQSEITYNAVSEFLRNEGSILGLRKKALNAQLVSKKFIMPGDRNTYTAYHKEKGALRTYAFFRPVFDK